jgi:hypothetical protein
MTAAPEAILRWPAERFYWTVLEAPGITRGGELPVGLRAAFEDEVPVSGDELHAVCAPMGGGRLLVCAAERRDLEAIDPATLSHTPESVPGFIEAADAQPGALELLVGAFEPRPVRRARAHRRAVAISTLLLCSALVGVGLMRRAANERAAAALAGDATARTLASISMSSADALSMELVRLRGFTHPEQVARTEAEATPALAALLAAWPAKVPSKPQSIAVNTSGIAVSLTVDGDAGPFLGALKPPAGWSLDEPRLNTAGSVTRVNLQLRPSEGGRQ